MSTTQKGNSHRFPKKFNDFEILKSIQSGEELKTSTIQKRLPYDGVSKDWVRKTLEKLMKKGFVVKVKKEDEIADYWVITEAGVKKVEELKRKQGEY